MRKLYLCLCFLAISFWANAQVDTALSAKDKAVLDSMIKSADDLLDFIDDSSRNYLDVSIGFGNGTFSTQNQAVNATGYTNQLVLTPALFYYFKSGFNVGLTTFLTNENSKLSLYQTGALVGYGYDGDKISTGISYTRNFGDNKKYNGKSIYQNEVFGYFKYTKPFIQPGISLGFANGNYKLAEFVSFLKTVPLFNPRRDTTILIKGTDSTANKTQYLSISISAEHQFEFENIFTNNDVITITPMVMLNMGSDKLTENHTNNLFANRPRLAAKYLSRKKTSQTNKMQLQSIASSINITYGIGKFYLQPNLYFDYYLPKTTEQRFSSIFSFTAGFSF
ncbi:MAG: hypothetical protein KA319_07600 [Ferruginibacter sp.]|nr:hypothetical protein [Ferruginibacter sp.]